MSLLEDLVALVGSEHVLTGEEASPYLTDWRNRYSGRCLAVVKPADTEELAEVVKLCQQADAPMVPQGGNTGLCGGATPSNKGDAVIILLSRMNKVLDVDTANDTMTVQAGCILQDVQDAADKAGRLFPLSLGAEGSCTIGGNLATNAGGTQVLRYGNARDLCLGLEVVTAEGDIVNTLKSLRKDNTGYDLRNLFIGSEGTLGIITAATLKLFPKPAAVTTAFLALEGFEQAIKVLNRSKRQFDASLTGFELISDYCLSIVQKHLSHIRIPFPVDTAPWYVLMEISDSEGEEHAREMFERVIGEAFENNEILDAVIAESIQQSNELWHLREAVPLAEAEVGKAIKNDISIPVSKMDEFVRITNTKLQEFMPGIQMSVFGHLGDGNLHYNVCPPDDERKADFLTHQDEIFKIVFDSVHEFDGSISAEHGIGQLKRDILPEYKDENAMWIMRKIKRALDPNSLLNPGKVISSVEINP
ncbi:FAD-binding oxidoreductase [Taylorella asinigenitalis]|uniref:FAD-binding oxidoreductase n=1 Tax=Taylorella asinigenitalis TaxID=84590 RepID=UPI0004920C24|nr:FAD-binding oxidoreductase [Taylorella asinigenitalis]